MAVYRKIEILPRSRVHQPPVLVDVWWQRVVVAIPITLRWMTSMDGKKTMGAMGDTLFGTKYFKITPPATTFALK